MKFGAHISGGGSLAGTVEKAERLGVECVQLFASPPSNWKPPRYTEADMISFKQAVANNHWEPNFFHAIYLLNFGSDNPELRQKSVQSLINYLTIAPKMGMLGAIFHTGSHKGVGFEAIKKQVCDGFNEILAATPKESFLIIENNAGQGNLIAKDAGEIAQLIDAIKNKDRVAVCIDTCHAFATGTDWRLPDQIDAFVNEFDRLVGWDRVVAIHANDSKFDLGQNKDRHENIGEGHIGTKGFKNILRHEKFQHLPFIIETPGFDGQGPDAKNLARLRESAV